MPSVDELTAAQAHRRATILSVLGQAGWTSDNALWDAGISSDWVAVMRRRSFGAQASCEYVITGNGVLPEFLQLIWHHDDGQFTVAVDFLGLTARRDEAAGETSDRLAEVLDILRDGPEQGHAERLARVLPALVRICPVFGVDEANGLMPIRLDQDGRLVLLTGADADGGPDPGSVATPDDDAPDEDDVEISYLDEVTDRLWRELSRTGWRRSPEEAQIFDVLEDFYLDAGPVRLSVGRVNQSETRVRLIIDDTQIRFRIDGLTRPEHADRLIGLLTHWQQAITPETWRDFMEALLGAYPRVFAESDERWHRIRPGNQTRDIALAPGVEQRAESLARILGPAGWSPAPDRKGCVASRHVRNGFGAVLRLDHRIDPLPEALTLTVTLPDDPAGGSGAEAEFVLDVTEPARVAPRDRMTDVLNVLATWTRQVNAETFMRFVAALDLCCAMYQPGEDELEPVVFPIADLDDDITIPLPRAIETIEGLLSQPGNDTAELWWERGLAALADDRRDLAAQSFTAAVQRDPAHGPAHLLRGTTIGIADPDEAGRAFLRCGELGFASGPAYVQYAEVLHVTGRKEHALEVCRYATRTLPEYGRGWYVLALLAVKEGRHQESIDAATEAVRLLPEHANAFYTRACGYALTGRPEPALADIAKALELNSSLRPQIRADDDFAALREDKRFIDLVDPWPDSDDDKPGMHRGMAEALRRAGWRPDEFSISIGRFSSLEYPCPAGRLIVGQHDDEVYVNLRPRGDGEDAEGWLYVSPGERATSFGELLASWGDRLTGENFPRFADQVREHFPEVTWHRGHP